MTDLYYCGPSLHCQKTRRNLFWATFFNAYKLYYYRIEPNNSNDLLAEPVFFNERIKKLETRFSHTQIGLKNVFTILQVFLETLDSC